MKLAIPEISEGEKYLGAIMPLSNVGLGGWFPIETAPKDGTQFIAYKQPDDPVSYTHLTLPTILRV